MKILVDVTYDGRGSDPHFTLYTCDKFVQFFNETYGIRKQQLLNIWNGDPNFLIRYVDNENVTGVGICEVDEDDKWLILFDPNCDASYRGEIGRVKNGEDLDLYIKNNYMITHDLESLDWTGKTSYRSNLKDDYTSEFHESCLIDYTSGNRGHGITRIDVNKWDFI
jgi:hypothetical protein